MKKAVFLTFLEPDEDSIRLSNQTTVARKLCSHSNIMIWFDSSLVIQYSRVNKKCNEVMAELCNSLINQVNSYNSVNSFFRTAIGLNRLKNQILISNSLSREQLNLDTSKSKVIYYCWKAKTKFTYSSTVNKTKQYSYGMHWCERFNTCFPNQLQEW